VTAYHVVGGLGSFGGRAVGCLQPPSSADWARQSPNASTTVSAGATQPCGSGSVHASTRQRVHPPPPQVSQTPELARIQAAKAFVLADNGLSAPDLLADNFRYVSPYSDTLDKKQYLALFSALALRKAFPDLDYRPHVRVKRMTHYSCTRGAPTAPPSPKLTQIHSNINTTGLPCGPQRPQPRVVHHPHHRHAQGWVGGWVGGWVVGGVPLPCRIPSPCRHVHGMRTRRAVCVSTW
jgi:hypothetical protein